jgi:hypothetical protein
MGAVTIIHPRPMLERTVGCGQLYLSDGYWAPCTGSSVNRIRKRSMCESSLPIVWELIISASSKLALELAGSNLIVSRKLIGREVIPLNGDESIKLTSKKLLVGINAG